MPELTARFQSLPPEYQRVLQLAQNQHQISVSPLQTLVGGWSGAMVYLVSVTYLDSQKVEHFILKLDRKSPKARTDELARHVSVQNKSPAEFGRNHLATLAFERLEADGAIAIFYSIAGQSLQSFRPLSNFGQQQQLETIFSATNQYLLAEWNASPTFTSLPPQELLEKWLGFRLGEGAPIESFIRQVCQAEPDRPGFLIQSNVYPNPLWYARQREAWRDPRPIDAILGLQHGDLNTNNILVKFSPDQRELTGYYLIDFALFKDEMPLLYDLRYLEMSYLTLAMSQVSLARTVELILQVTEGAGLDPRRAPIEMAGISAVITSARTAFDRWVTEAHPSLQDDLWGQYWLAGVAAGLAYCHKAGQADEQRLAGLIYAAANLKRYFMSFSIALPTDVELLYAENQFGSPKTVKSLDRNPALQKLPSDFAPLRAEEVVNHNLPTQLTEFIGREMELASLHALLSDVHNRLITIVAPGGMGKTRLSLEAAGQMIQVFPQGIYFVALDRITSPDLIVQAVAEVLPISLSSNEDPKTRILEFLREKKILLVMDNFEHVLDGATFVQEILSAAPQVQVLASSRAKLNLMGETVFTIEGLTIGDSTADKNSALQLFAQSARRMRPQFELDAKNLPVVKKVCLLVGGMPLAILLAAAWIDTLSVEEIAAEIETSLDMLETEKRDVPDRQRSVRAVIESSWNQVDASAQNLLKRLSVFRGGFTRAAAQEAAGASLRGLSQLVDKALLRRDPGTGRYSIHELLRQYGEEQLKRSEEEEQSAHENHAKYFAGFMKTREEQLHDQRQKTILLEIEADFDNIRVAWNYWVERQDANRILEFVSALWLFFEVRGSFTPAIQFFGDAARQLTTSEPEIIQACAQLRARQSWFTALIGLPEEGLQIAHENLEILRQFGSQNIGVETFQCANINAIFMNNYEIVMQISQEMMERAKRSGDIWERGWALIWWAYALVIQRQVTEALQAGQEALSVFEKLGNPFGLSVASGIILGAISMAIGDTAAAKTHYLRGVEAGEEINYLRLLQISNDNLGTAALLEGDVQEAQQFFLKSLRISQECGQTREMLASLRDLANVQIAQGNLDSALKLLAVVLKHPTSGQNSLNRPERLRDEAEKLRAMIESQLDPALYQSAWETGHRQRLADVVTQILN